MATRCRWRARSTRPSPSAALHSTAALQRRHRLPARAGHEGDRAGARALRAGCRCRRLPGHRPASGSDHGDGPSAPAGDGRRDRDELSADERRQSGHHGGFRTDRPGSERCGQDAWAARRRRDGDPQSRAPGHATPLLHALLGQRRPDEAGTGAEGGARPYEQPQVEPKIHSLAVDPRTHRVYAPAEQEKGRPASKLRSSWRCAPLYSSRHQRGPTAHSSPRTRPLPTREKSRSSSAISTSSGPRSEEHTSELQSRLHLVCRLLLEKKKKYYRTEKRKTTIYALLLNAHEVGTL